MIRSLNGSSDYIDLSIGNCNNQYGTFAAIVKRGATAAGFHSILAHHTSAPAAQNLFGFSNNNIVLNISGQGSTTGQAVNDTTSWWVVAGSKDTGTVVGRFHTYQFSTRTWTHQDGDIARSNWADTSGGKVTLGRWDTSNYFNGYLAIAAFWGNTTLTDAQSERLSMGISNWMALSPNGLWLLNQPSVSTLNDFTGGGANETAIDGTSAVDEIIPFDNLPMRNIEVGNGQSRNERAL